MASFLSFIVCNKLSVVFLHGIKYKLGIGLESTMISNLDILYYTARITVFQLYYSTFLRPICKVKCSYP